ncbi:DUF4167 domain-containing protein [Candidatus Pelagibacter ubique]|uniref:DUF4167 domain-containing protein n=1 Tax=Pelagibacter ubique TaxID=198252 RepID=UPI0003D1C1C7|tara:strand:+ start:63 stop:518 length:456 start_codon:yes stop_codon:yes gene_type:complete
MVTFRNNNNNNNRRSGFRRNTRNFKSNGDNSKFAPNFSNNENFKRKSPGRNNHNAPKLIEKYNDLAREALSNGDKILSENYLQHADHFTRILNERESFRRDKFLENKSENNSEISEENIENSEKNSAKDLENNPNDKNKIQKDSKSQLEII